MECTLLKQGGRVSIPFKRERTGKVKFEGIDPEAAEFQFPSNGNAQGKRKKNGSIFTKPIMSFNSLQTGTHRESVPTDVITLGKIVSIPFKRERTGKGRSSGWGSCIARWFQFPSNGKAHGKHVLGMAKSKGITVSIPFKREGTWKVVLCNYCKYVPSVSIPFKREGTWKVARQFGNDGVTVTFQFPSNGKAHGKYVRTLRTRHGCSSFQFPSNGKAHGKRPPFRPRRDGAPNPQNQTRTAHGFFSLKIHPKNPINPCGH